MLNFFEENYKNKEKNLLDISSSEKTNSSLQVNTNSTENSLSLFVEKANSQWEEVLQALNEEILLPQKLFINKPAENIAEFNKIESLLEEAIAEKIKRVSIKTTFFNITLDLSKLSLTRFPLKELLKDERYRAALLEITYLNLSYNRLHGPIPPELSQLINLQHLDLCHNQFSGPIPSELKRLINLVQLNLNENKLSGSIPTVLSELSNLKSLTLDINQLSGIIPPQLGKLVNLKILYLNNNQLSGPIPKEFIKLINLSQLWLEHNKLSGFIPTELEQLDNLRSLFLHENNLEGAVPIKLAKKFPGLVDSNGHVADQHCLNSIQEAKNKPSFKP